MKTINKDFTNCNSQTVATDLYFGALNSMFKNNIQEDLVLHKTTMKALEQLCVSVADNADTETLKLFGTDVEMTYTGLCVRVFDMLESLGISLEHPTPNTIKQLDEYEGKLFVGTAEEVDTVH